MAKVPGLLRPLPAAGALSKSATATATSSNADNSAFVCKRGCVLQQPARDAADVLRLSPSWLAKARMRGDGPPFVKLGRSIRYSETALAQFMKAHVRLSTSER